VIARGRAAAAVVAVLSMATVLGGAAPPAGAASTRSAVRRAAAYLARAQNGDGGLGGRPREGSAQLFSGWAALGLAASGREISRLRGRRGGPTLLDYVRRGAGTRDIGSIERTILVVHGAGASPRRFDGRDLVTELAHRFSRRGAVAGQVNVTAFGVLALAAAHADERLQARGRAWLIGQQDRDGGWNFAGRGASSDADDTGAVLEALGAVHGRRVARARRRAGGYLHRIQDRDGGFPAGPGEGANAQSTAWAVQGLDAARAQARVRNRALGYLRAMQKPDGAIRYSTHSTQTPVWVTAEALMALRGAPLPIEPR
jgi:energy-coupling factor transport system substrate-specific component